MSMICHLDLVNSYLRLTIIMEKVGKHIFVLVSGTLAQMNEYQFKANNRVVLSHEINRQLLIEIYN